MTYNVRCDVCGREDFNLLYDMGGKYSIIKCGHCGLWLSHPILSKKEICAMYAKYHENWGVIGKDEDMHRAMRHATFRRLFKILSRYKAPQGRLLDVGCATGICMEAGKEFGWDVYGVDISEEAVASARVRFGPKVEALDFANAKQIPSDRYDVVIMTDVLEHLNDVKSVMKNVHSMLKLGGVVVVVTVDTSSFFARIIRSKWLFIHRQHLIYFSKKNLKLFLEDIGFKVLKLERSLKSTNLYYLAEYFGQKGEDLPRLKTVSNVMKTVIGWLPKRLRYFDMMVPTGDVLVIARKG